MSLGASLAVGLSQLHILVCPRLTQPLNLLLCVLQLHCMPLHGGILLLQHLHSLFDFLGAHLLLCELCLGLYQHLLRQHSIIVLLLYYLTIFLGYIKAPCSHFFHINWQHQLASSTAPGCYHSTLLHFTDSVHLCGTAWPWAAFPHSGITLACLPF